MGVDRNRLRVTTRRSGIVQVVVEDVGGSRIARLICSCLANERVVDNRCCKPFGTAGQDCFHLAIWPHNRRRSIGIDIPLTGHPARSNGGQPVDAIDIGSVLPGYEYSGWFAIFAPKGTSADIVSRLNADFRAVLSIPEVTQKFGAIGLEPTPSTPAELSALVVADHKKIGALARAIGLKPQ